jgi:hypothetical protein
MFFSCEDVYLMTNSPPKSDIQVDLTIPSISAVAVSQVNGVAGQHLGTFINVVMQLGERFG